MDGLDFNRIRLRDLACDCLQSKNLFFREKYGSLYEESRNDASGRFKNEKEELEAERTESIVRKGTILS